MKSLILLTALSFLLIGKSFCQEMDTISGVIDFISNPCTTEPCLPGVSIALRSDTADFYIIGAYEQYERIIIKNDTFSVGDSILVIGIIIAKKDINDEIYYEIDIKEFLPLSTNIDLFQKKIDIILYPNPVIDYLIVKNEGNLIFKRIEITDINGKLILSSEIYCNTINISNIKYKGVGIISLITANNKVITKKILLK